MKKINLSYLTHLVTMQFMYCLALVFVFAGYLMFSGAGMTKDETLLTNILFYSFIILLIVPPIVWNSIHFKKKKNAGEMTKARCHLLSQLLIVIIVFLILSK
jgi:hypothetical protein